MKFALKPIKPPAEKLNSIFYPILRSDFFNCNKRLYSKPLSHCRKPPSSNGLSVSHAIHLLICASYWTHPTKPFFNIVNRIIVVHLLKKHTLSPLFTPLSHILNNKSVFSTHNRFCLHRPRIPNRSCYSKHFQLQGPSFQRPL